MELFVQQPKRDQKCQNFCLLLVFSIKFMKPNICKVYPAIPHGIEVEHWSVYPKVSGSNLVGSRFFFLVLKNLCSNFDLYLAFLALDMVRMLKYLQISIFGAFLSWFNHRNNLWTIFPYSWHFEKVNFLWFPHKFPTFRKSGKKFQAFWFIKVWSGYGSKNYTCYLNTLYMCRLNYLNISY